MKIFNLAHLCITKKAHLCTSYAKKGFMKAVKAFIKPFLGTTKKYEKKVYVNCVRLKNTKL